MYTDTQQAIRNSLWNFMGSLLTASSLEGVHAKESVIALMSEEMCKFVKQEDNESIDMVAAKPLLKATSWILDAKLKELYKTLDEAPKVAHEAIINNINNINNIKIEIDLLIDNI